MSFQMRKIGEIEYNLICLAKYREMKSICPHYHKALKMTKIFKNFFFFYILFYSSFHVVMNDAPLIKTASINFLRFPNYPSNAQNTPPFSVQALGFLRANSST